MAYLTQAYRGDNYNGEAGWWLHFHYDKETVEELKRDVSHVDRERDEERTRWHVVDGALDTLLDIFPNFASFRDQPMLL